MKNKRTVKVLFALLFILFFVLVSKSTNSAKAETASFGQSFKHAYTMSGSWTAYCRQHGLALGGQIGGLAINELDYTQETGAQDLEPATAYAYYCGARGESLQNVIWYSKLWTGGPILLWMSSGVAGINQRYKAYGDVYYGIIKPFQNINSTNKSLFSITSDTKEENVKVMVNQQNKKYIVGPYKIELKPNIPNVTVNLSEINNEQRKANKALVAKLKTNGKCF